MFCVVCVCLEIDCCQVFVNVECSKCVFDVMFMVGVKCDSVVNNNMVVFGIVVFLLLFDCNQGSQFEVQWLVDKVFEDYCVLQFEQNVMFVQDVVWFDVVCVVVQLLW